MLRTSRYVGASLIALAAAGAKPACAAATLTAAAKPVFSLGTGSYAGSQSVTITDATPGFVIHYTIDGSAPTAASKRYWAPIRVTSSETIKAIAVAAGHADSAVASATYRIADTGIVATPASLAFPVLNLGHKAVTMAVTFKNTGITPVRSLSINLVGAARTAYSTAQTCGTTLSPGASCVVSVTFDPKRGGVLPAALRVAGSGTHAASVSIDGLCTDATEAAADGNTYLFKTTQGDIYVALRPDAAPKNVANFLHYVGNGTYTNTLFHRVVAGFVNQGGGYKLVSGGHTSSPPTVAPVVNEYKLPNVRGTIAMAKLGGNPNSATDQFFFNVVNNMALNIQNGGFTVIGQIMGVQGVAGATQAAGLAVMDAINADPVYNFGSPFDSIPLLNYTPGKTVEAANVVTVKSVTVVKPAVGAPATPQFSIGAGTYKSAQTIRLSDATPGATIYYYLSGSPTRTVTQYTGPLTVAKSQYLSAYAVAPGYPRPSDVQYAYFQIAAP